MTEPKPPTKSDAFDAQTELANQKRANQVEDLLRRRPELGKSIIRTYPNKMLDEKKIRTK